MSTKIMHRKITFGISKLASVTLAELRLETGLKSITISAPLCHYAFSNWDE